MKKYDFIPGVFFVVLGIASALGSWRLELGTFKTPGAGLVPFLISVILIILSIIVVITSHEIRRSFQEVLNIWSGVDIKKIVLVLVYLLGYAFCLEKIGYITTTLIFFLILLKTVGSLKWRVVIITSVLAVSLSYVMFVVFLKVQLPSGIWGIG